MNNGKSISTGWEVVTDWQEETGWEVVTDWQEETDRQEETGWEVVTDWKEEDMHWQDPYLPATPEMIRQ